MPDTPQDPQTSQDQQDTSAQPFMNFFPGQETQATPQTDPSEQLKAMFGPSGDKVPLEHNDSATNLATGLKKVFNPSPIDSQSVRDFNFEFRHKFEPERTDDGRIALNPDGSPIYKKELDASGNPIIDPKTGQPVLEKSTLYASPARRLLQGFLTNALTLGAPAIQGHPDVVREIKKEQFNTERQVALQTAYKNAQTNVAYARIQASNDRQARSLELKRDAQQMNKDQFEQKHQISLDRYKLADKLRQDHEEAQTARLKNITLTREQTLLNRAYGPAAAQAQAEYVRDNPGRNMEDAAIDPHVLARSAELYSQLKPHEAANMAIEKMVGNGELTAADLQNPAGIVNAAQKSSLSAEEKKAILLDQLSGQQKFGQQQENIKLQNAGRVAGYRVLGQNKLTNEIVVEDEQGNAHTVAVGPNQPFPTGGMTVTQAGSQNVVPPAERGQGYQAGIVTAAGERLMSFIDQNRDKVGNWDAIRKELLSNGPIADPFINELDSQIASYAALNPKMHGFRGQNAYLAFEKLVGRPFKNADALIASIRGINNTADIIKEYTSPNTSPMLPKNQGAGGKGQPARVDFQRDPKNPSKFIAVPVKK